MINSDSHRPVPPLDSGVLASSPTKTGKLRWVMKLAMSGTRPIATRRARSRHEGSSQVAIRVGRHAAVAALLVLSLSVAACSGAASDRGGVLPTTAGAARPLTDDDVALIRSAATRARDAAMGSYELVQSLHAGGEDQGQVLTTRRGEFNKTMPLHLLEVGVPDRGDKGPIELAFLTTDRDVLMKNPAFTARHGREWTRLPSEALAQFGVDLAAAAFEPPALDVVASAALPGEALVTDGGSTKFEVSVSEYDAIELVGNQGYVKLAELTGLSPEELLEEFAGTMPATVVVTPDGTLTSLKVDLRPIFEKASALSTQPAGDVDASIHASLTFTFGTDVQIAVPTEDEVAAFE